LKGGVLNFLGIRREKYKGIFLYAYVQEMFDWLARKKEK